MIQEHIYKKDIMRPINGVIKADSKAELANEITEYVITAEQIGRASCRERVCQYV